MSAVAALARPHPGIDRRGLALLCGGHLAVDLCQGSLVALLPFLVARRGYSYAEATSLLLVMTLASSLIQPAFGQLSDRLGTPRLVPAGLLVAAAGIAATALAGSYGVALGAVAVAGLGVGAFHPEAAVFAGAVSGGRRATGMSFFSIGGNAGFALAPLIVTPIALSVGIEGVALVALIPVTLALVITMELPRLEQARGSLVAVNFARRDPDPDPVTGAAQPAAARRAAVPSPRGAFARLTAAACLRSGVYSGMQAFLAAFFIEELGTGAATGNAALTVLLVAGTIGTLAGGWAGDRVGARAVLLGCMIVLGPLVALLLVAPSPAIALVLVALIGFFCIGNFSVVVVLGQELLPARAGVASGMLLGAAFGAGGIIAQLLAVLADHAGLVPVVVALALLPVPAAALSRTLPPGDRRPAAA